MRALLITVCVLLYSSGFAQHFAFELWHDGKLVLDTGDTLRGNIKYNMQENLIQLQASGRNESLTARKVLFFEIFDNTVKHYRQFYSLPYSSNGTYKAPVFFELLEEGKITLLGRESIEYRTYSSPYSFYGSYTRLVLVNKYFLLQENGEIKDAIDKKNDWLGLMGNKGEDVHKYAKANKLDFDNKEELVKIIDYYNSFFTKK